MLYFNDYYIKTYFFILLYHNFFNNSIGSKEKNGLSPIFFYKLSEINRYKLRYIANSRIILQIHRRE